MFKKILAIIGILALLTGCTANRQCRKVSLSERTMSSELVNSFVRHQFATIWGDELKEEDRNSLILSHEEYVKIFIERHGLEVYTEVGEMYYDEFVRKITLNFIRVIQEKNLVGILQMQYVYQNVVVDPIYVQETTKDLAEGLVDFDENKFNKTMDELKIDFMNKWTNLIKEGK